MSLLLNLGARAMNASQSVISTIGHNIANANTPGYSRQTAVLKTATPQFTGAGFQGKGVAVDTINRVYNRFLTQEAYGSRAAASGDETLLLNLQRLEKVFPPGEAGLGKAMSDFLNAMVDVASRPADPAARQVVLGRAKEMATRFSSAGAQLNDLQAGVASDLRANVQIVNTLAKQLANVNGQIQRLNGGEHDTNDLLDQRDNLIYEISKYVTVSTLEAEDGSMGVFIGGGQRLVLSNQAAELVVEQDPYDPLRVQLALKGPTNTLPLDAALLTGGSMSSLLAFQNRDLQDARNYIGQLATAMTMRVNTQQSLGLDLSTPSGAGVAMLAVGAERVLPATTNARDLAGNFLSGVSITRVDPDFLQASSYILKGDPAAVGSYLLVRESDGFTQSVVNGQTIDGFRIDFAPLLAPPGPLDTFRLEPVAMAAADMRRTLDLPAGIAAASPASAVTTITNRGSATIDSVFASDRRQDPPLPLPPLPSSLPISIRFTTPVIDPLTGNPTGQMNYDITDPFGTSAGIWTPGQPIRNGLGGDLEYELRINGVPKGEDLLATPPYLGDTITLVPTPYPNQNNGNVKAFIELQGENFVGKRLNPLTGDVSAGATLNEAYSAAMGEIGSRVQGTEYLAAVSDQVARDADAAKAAEAGVNLDEEAARLLQYQQAYQAAAKLLQVAQVVFDELISTVR